MFYLFIFEFLGTTELLVILVVALVLFGPRKLPQLSRSLGKSLGEFKRASEEFKQTWEREVAMESVEKEKQTEQAMLPEDNSILGPVVGREKTRPFAAAETAPSAEASEATPLAASSMDEGAAASPLPHPVSSSSSADAVEPTSKRDWL